MSEVHDVFEEMRRHMSNDVPARGLSKSQVLSSVQIDDKLIWQYCHGDPAELRLASFKIVCLLQSIRSREFTQRHFEAFRGSLSERLLSENSVVTCDDITIAAQTNLQPTKTVLTTLVKRLRGVDDFGLIAASAVLVPVIGHEYLLAYRDSDLVGETGGIGGPLRFVLRDAALLRLNFHLGVPLVDVRDPGQNISGYAWPSELG